ncbi:MAG: hypothetical protein JXR97_14645, partial [Planctomycetes bacterium]|nr:hypothetical protein [Planctomycetota bacterium]
RFTRKADGDYRACYTFCMCPGGSVISCASTNGLITTNGMSLSARGRFYGNAAFLVPVSPEDFKDESPLAGIGWQEKIEAAAFAEGGSDYTVPAAMLPDFVNGVVSSALPENRSCPRSVPADFARILPDEILQTLKHSSPKMLRLMSGIKIEEAICYAAETRSSSPVRVTRGDDYQSTGVPGLYPAGEGAGYAGGIVTSAIDGYLAAESLAANL